VHYGRWSRDDVVGASWPSRAVTTCVHGCRFDSQDGRPARRVIGPPRPARSPVQMPKRRTSARYHSVYRSQLSAVAQRLHAPLVCARRQRREAPPSPPSNISIPSSIAIVAPKPRRCVRPSKAPPKRTWHPEGLSPSPRGEQRPR